MPIFRPFSTQGQLNPGPRADRAQGTILTGPSAGSLSGIGEVFRPSYRRAVQEEPQIDRTRGEGEGMAQFSSAMLNIAAEMVDEENRLTAEGYKTRYEDELRALSYDGPAAYFNLEGENAVKAEQFYKQRVDAITEKYRDEMPSHIQRYALPDILQNRDMYLDTAAKYSVSQRDQWRKDVQQQLDFRIDRGIKDRAKNPGSTMSEISDYIEGALNKAFNKDSVSQFIDREEARLRYYGTALETIAINQGSKGLINAKAWLDERTDLGASLSNAAAEMLHKANVREQAKEDKQYAEGERFRQDKIQDIASKAHTLMYTEGKGAEAIELLEQEGEILRSPGLLAKAETYRERLKTEAENSGRRPTNPDVTTYVQFANEIRAANGDPSLLEDIANRVNQNKTMSNGQVGSLADMIMIAPEKAKDEKYKRLNGMVKALANPASSSAMARLPGMTSNNIYAEHKEFQMLQDLETLMNTGKKDGTPYSSTELYQEILEKHMGPNVPLSNGANVSTYDAARDEYNRLKTKLDDPEQTLTNAEKWDLYRIHKVVRPMLEKTQPIIDPNLELPRTGARKPTTRMLAAHTPPQTTENAASVLQNSVRPLLRITDEDTGMDLLNISYSPTIGRATDLIIGGPLDFVVEESERIWQDLTNQDQWQRAFERAGLEFVPTDPEVIKLMSTMGLSGPEQAAELVRHSLKQTTPSDEQFKQRVNELFDVIMSGQRRSNVSPEWEAGMQRVFDNITRDWERTLTPDEKFVLLKQSDAMRRRDMSELRDERARWDREYSNLINR